jgi:hypothetical protein
MKEKILQFLKTKLTGVQESYLLGVAESFSKTITEESQIETVLSGGVIDAIKFAANQIQTEGDRRANDAVKTAVENFRKKHNLDENGKPITTPNPPPGGGDEVPAWAKQLQETVTTLAGTVQTVTNENAKAAKRNEAKVKLKAKGVSEKHLDDFTSRVNIDAENLEAEIERVANSYTAFRQDFINEEVAKGNYNPIIPEGETDDKMVQQLDSWGKQFEQKQ